MIEVFAVNIVVVGLAVAIHYEFLRGASQLLPKIHLPHRTRIVLGVVVAMTAHAAEVWLFALAYYFMHHADGWGELQKNFDGSLLDCAYYSFTVFSTLGTGDIEPLGDLRFLSGLESLAGLVLITWTASFLYLEMSRYWNSRL